MKVFDGFSDEFGADFGKGKAVMVFHGLILRLGGEEADSRLALSLFFRHFHGYTGIAQSKKGLQETPLQAFDFLVGLL